MPRLKPGTEERTKVTHKKWKPSTIERIDKIFKVAGKRNRSHYIEEAVVATLEKDERKYK